MADESSPKVNSNEDQTASASSAKGGGWFSWYTDAKAKTLSTLDLVKRDLVEFRESVGQQAATTFSSVMPPTAQQAPQILGHWVKGLAQTVNEAVLKMGDTTFGEDGETEIIVGKSEKGQRSKSFANGKLFVIQSDPGTFTNEPSGAPELFEDWLDHFIIAHKELEIETALDESTVLRENYAALVPSKISRETFWSRYFYKIHQFELEDKASRGGDQATSVRSDESREQLFKRTLSSNDSGDVSWGDDSDLDELSAIAAKTCISNNSQPTNDTPDHIDEKLATAVLEREDMEQKLKNERQAKSDYCNDATNGTSFNAEKCSITPSDILSLSDSSETIPSNGNESDIDQTAVRCPNDKPASPSLDVELKSATSKTVISPSLDEELSSERSFCMITSTGSSFNGETLSAQR